MIGAKVIPLAVGRDHFRQTHTPAAFCRNIYDYWNPLVQAVSHMMQSGPDKYIESAQSLITDSALIGRGFGGMAIMHNGIAR
jgi:hypothetical protein